MYEKLEQNRKTGVTTPAHLVWNDPSVNKAAVTYTQRASPTFCRCKCVVISPIHSTFSGHMGVENNTRLVLFVYKGVNGGDWGEVGRGPTVSSD